LLIEKCIAHFKKETQFDVNYSQQAREKIRIACKEAKIKLSKEEQVTIEI